MKLVLLGAGNVASALGERAMNAGHSILQVFSRTLENAETLASHLQAAATNEFGKITSEAELYIVALTDTATQSLHQHWHCKKGMVVHTAGAVPIAALEKVARNFGVLYPLQSLRPGRIPATPLPLLVDANTADDLTSLTDFAETIGNEVHHFNDVQRLQYHLAAVFANNFTNHLYHLAATYCTKNGLDFNLLYPIIVETAVRLNEGPPFQWQTGPAIRGDEATMEKHIQLLKEQPSMESIYLLLSESIQWQTKPKPQTPTEDNTF